MADRRPTKATLIGLLIGTGLAIIAAMGPLVSAITITVGVETQVGEASGLPDARMLPAALEGVGFNLFPQLARAVDEIGFATFRYDKRGVGASGGDYWATGFNDRLTDAIAAVKWMASQPTVDDLGYSCSATAKVR